MSRYTARRMYRRDHIVCPKDHGLFHQPDLHRNRSENLQ